MMAGRQNGSMVERTDGRKQAGGGGGARGRKAGKTEIRSMGRSGHRQQDQDGGDGWREVRNQSLVEGGTTAVL